MGARSDDFYQPCQRNQKNQGPHPRFYKQWKVAMGDSGKERALEKGKFKNKKKFCYALFMLVLTISYTCTSIFCRMVWFLIENYKALNSRDMVSVVQMQF